MKLLRLIYSIVACFEAARASTFDGMYSQGLDSPAMDGSLKFWVHDNQFDSHTLPFRFAGLNTFAKLPYANCFENNTATAPKFDIAILGAPHDTVRNTFVDDISNQRILRRIPIS